MLLRCRALTEDTVAAGARMRGLAIGALNPLRARALLTPREGTPILILSSRRVSMQAPTSRASSASIAMLRKLVAFPTVSRDSNLELIHFARDYLQDLGAESRLTYDDERRKANLFATLGPRGTQ